MKTSKSKKKNKKRKEQKNGVSNGTREASEKVYTSFSLIPFGW